MFDRALEVAQKHGVVVVHRNDGFPHTQLVLGEWHYIPRVQRDLLHTLEILFYATHFWLLGKEGNRGQFQRTNRHPVDYKRAVKDDAYMRELLCTKVNATAIFAKAHALDVIAKVVDDPSLRAIAGRIDQKCFQLFRQKQRASHRALTDEQNFEYNFWFKLLREIVLGARSDVMIHKLYRWQEKLDAPLAVLVCGCAHTPYCEAYAPFSVLRVLEQLPLNFIIAIPNAAWDIVETQRTTRDPLDFYSPVDQSEVSPYAK